MSGYVSGSRDVRRTAIRSGAFVPIVDAGLAALVVCGALVGVIASAVPGLHVNALSAFVVAFAPTWGAPGVAFLLAAFAASPFGVALSSPFFGGTGEDSALAGLPAHAMAREGRAVEAVALQAWGALAGVLFALPLAFLARGALVAVAPRLADAMPWLLIGIVVMLVVSEPRRLRVHRRRVVVGWRGPGTRTLSGPLTRRGDVVRVGWRRIDDPHGLLADHANGATVRVQVDASWGEGPLSRTAGRAAAVVVLGLSGMLGLAAFRLGASSPFGLPASPLLPLLAGIFGVPGLIAVLHARSGVPRSRLRAAVPPRGELPRAAGPGAVASALLGLVPGVSASHAGLLLPRGASSETMLIRLAAVNGGAVVFTLLAWHALSKARSGVLVAAQVWAPPAAWRTWSPPLVVVEEAMLVVFAAMGAFLMVRFVSMPLTRRAGRLAPRPLAWSGLTIVAAATFAMTGLLGLFELFIAACVGHLAPRWGVRRSHAMGVILIPALLRAWGLA